MCECVYVCVCVLDRCGTTIFALEADLFYTCIYVNAGNFLMQFTCTLKCSCACGFFFFSCFFYALFFPESWPNRVL